MRKRDNYWQIIRGISVLAVILIHTLYLTENIYINYSNILIRKIINFAVATFLFIAGYFTSIKDIKTFYKNKIFRLIPALLIWDLVYCSYWCLNNNFTWIELLKSLILSTTSGHLYYIYVLLQLFLIAPIINLYIKKYINTKKIYIPLIITPICNLLYVMLGTKFNFVFPLYQYFIFGWFTYYYLGMLLNYKEINISVKKIVIAVFTSLIMSFIEGILIYNKYNLYSFAVSQLTIFNSFYSCTICLLIMKLKKKITKKNILSRIGDYSFGIYLSHMLVIQMINNIHNSITVNYYIDITLKYIITFITCYVINKIYYKTIKERLL